MTTGERDFVDQETHEHFTTYLRHALSTHLPTEHASGWIAGGKSSEQHFQRRPRNYNQLKQYENIYVNGGPVSDLIDSRALMTYGTGTEYRTENTAVTDEKGRTVDEFLDDTLGDLMDYLHIQVGIQAYWSGNGWLEIVENRAGEFAGLNLLDPTTLDASWDRNGNIESITQHIIEDGKHYTQELDPENIAIFSYTDTGGGPIEVGLIERNIDEIEQLASDMTHRSNAIKLHGSPHYDVSVGAEGQSIPERIIRLIRNRFRAERINEKTSWVHGGQIDINTVEAPSFEGMDNILETDMRVLAQGFGIPLEWTNFGADGLGSGAPAESRQTKFERGARAEQMLRKAQFIEQVIRPLLDKYSPFPGDIDLDIIFGDVVSDQQAAAEAYRDYSWAYHRDELREKLGDPAWNETDERDAPPELDPSASSDGGGVGGLFREAGNDGERDLQTDESALGHAEQLMDYILTYQQDGNDMTKPVPDFVAWAALEGIQIDRYADLVSAYLKHQTEKSLDEVRVEDLKQYLDMYYIDRGDRLFRSLMHDSITDSELTQEELVWGNVVDKVLWSDDTGRQLFEFDPEEVPDFVVERLRQAISAGAVFSDIDGLDAATTEMLKNSLLDSLEKSHGWSINSLRDNLMEQVPGLNDPRQAEAIARTETNSLVNKARELGYEEQFDVEQERFKWIGPNDNRNSDHCPWIKNQIPEEGVSMSRLKALIEEAQDQFSETPTRREWTPHIQCRHQAVRVV